MPKTDNKLNAKKLPLYNFNQVRIAISNEYLRIRKMSFIKFEFEFLKRLFKVANGLAR